MSNENVTLVPTGSTVPGLTHIEVVESAPAKKTPKAKKKPAAAKKTPAKATPSANGKAEKKAKSGLRGPQVRILTCLKKANKPLSRVEISKKAPVDQAACVEYIGSHNEEVRKANDVKHFPSLLTLGYVKAEQHDVDGRDVIQYAISAKGKAALEKAEK